MRQVLWTPSYRPALDTPLPSRLWTLTLPAASPSNASGHQIEVAQACGLKLNLCHKNSFLRLLRQGLSCAFLTSVLLQISLSQFEHLQEFFIYLDALGPLQFLCEFQIRYLAAR